MTSKGNNKKALTLIPLILMIFTSVFGFNNVPRAFFKMGYSAIPWYILSGITFFIPFAFMMAEFGSAFKKEKGGIYSWMEKSVGPKFAFVGTFMWYASYLVWMVNVGSGILVPLSYAIFGKNVLNSFALFGLSSPQTLGLFGVLWILFVTVISTRGLDKIKKVTSAGGTAVALLNIVLIIGAVIVLIGNHGHLAQPFQGIRSLTHSPNPSYGTDILQVLGFVVFALFAYGGIEVVGGLVDQTENPEKTFPKGVLISAVLISIGYSLGIFLVGIFTNWKSVLGADGVTMGNIGYVTMGNLGYQIGHALGYSEVVAASLGVWLARFVGLSMFLALSGAFFTLMYAPLKQIIEGTPSKLWPGKLGELKNGMPVNAMWGQGIIVCLMILIVAFGGDSISKFFDILTSMTNVAMTLPYMFIAMAFIPFKNNARIEKPFVIYKSYNSAVIWTIVVTLTVGFANFFSIIQPAFDGDIKTTVYSIAGPVLFSIIALLMYRRYEKIVEKEGLVKAA